MIEEKKRILFLLFLSPPTSLSLSQRIDLMSPSRSKRSVFRRSAIDRHTLEKNVDDFRDPGVAVAVADGDDEEERVEVVRPHVDQVFDDRHLRGRLGLPDRNRIQARIPVHHS